MAMLCLTLIFPCVITLYNTEMVLLTPFPTSDKCQSAPNPFVLASTYAHHNL